MGTAGGGDDVVVVREVEHLFDNVGESLEGVVPMGYLLMAHKLGLLPFLYFLKSENNWFKDKNGL